MHITFIYDVTQLKENENKIKKLNDDLNRWVNELNTLFEMLPMSVAIITRKMPEKCMLILRWKNC
jgi:hypothetical protein